MKALSPRASAPAPSRRGTPAAHFRAQIERAEANGASRGDMLLRLTHNDVSYLKRDPSLPIEDISFSDGVMSYLGVRIAQGGVSDSVLIESAADEPVVEPPAKPAKKTRAKPKAET